MVYTKGKLKGQLTTAEIRKLISAHNKLSKITIPPKSKREDILKLLTDKGFSVNHEQQKLEQIRVEKKDVDLEQAKEITKRKPRAKPVPKPKPKPKPLPKEDEVRPIEKVGRPKVDPNKIKVITPEKKKLLAIEDKKKEEKKKEDKPKRDFKINRSERKKMLGQLIDDTGGKMIYLHKVLGMKPSEETPELVKQKCRELKLKFHPDKNNEPDQDKFDLVQKVCKILLDTQEIGKGNDKEPVEALKKPKSGPISVREIFDSLIENSDEAILPFDSFPSSSFLMYSYILEKNKNDCSIPAEILKDFFSTRIKDRPILVFLKQNAKEIAQSIVDCHTKSRGKKAVVLPLTFRSKKTGGTHANTILFNTLQMTAEHFEPHGRKDYLPARKQFVELEGVNLSAGITAINKELKKLKFSVLKYMKPVDVCPSKSMYKNFKGVQSLDKSGGKGKVGEFTIDEIGGYCQLWGYFLLNLRLNTLKYPPSEVLAEYAEYRDIYKVSIKDDPNKTMMGLIRGYSKEFFNMIKELIDQGKFTLKEFLDYRDVLKPGTTRDASYKKVKAALFEAGESRMEKLMNNT